MADDEVIVPTAQLPDGVARQGYQTPAAPRGKLGYLRDLGLDVLSGVVDVAQTPATLARDVATEPSSKAAAQTVQHIALDTKDWLSRGKTDYGREQDVLAREGKADEKPWYQTAAEVVPQSAPALGAAAVTGPLAPLTFGALSTGASGLRAEDEIRNMPEADLYKTPKYKEFRDQGMSDAEARRALYTEFRSLASIAPDFAANVIFGGIAGRMVGKAFSRTVAGNMRQRIMQNVMRDVPEGVIGGGIQGAAVDYSYQAGQVQAGLREQVDPGQVWKSAKEMAQNLGVVSGALAGGRSVRGPARPGARPADTGSILEGADKRAAEIGTELKVVAEQNLIDAGARAAINPEGSTARVTPAGGERAVINPEGSTARVTPIPEQQATGEGGAPTIADEIQNKIAMRRAAQGLPPLEREGAAPPPTPMSTGEAAPSLLPVREAALVREGAPAEAAPVVPAVEAAPVVPVAEAKPEFTLDQLRARAADLSQTPTHGDLQRHIAEWKAANDGAKLPQQNEITQAWAKANDAARREQASVKAQQIKEGAEQKRQARAEEKAARAEAREAKKADQAKQAEIAKAEKAVAAEPFPGSQKHPDKEVEAKRQAWAQHVDKASTEQLSDPRWQAANDALFEAYTDAARAVRHAPEKKPTVGEQVKQKAAGKKVTPVGKEAPPLAALITEKKPTVGEQVKEKAAAKEPTVGEQVKVKAGLVKREEAEAKKTKAADIKHDQRDRQKTRREGAAKSVVERLAPDENEKPVWEAREAAIREGKVEDVLPHVAKVAETIDKMSGEYAAEIKTLQAGNVRHEIYTLGGGETGKARGQHGQYHGFLANLHNLNREMKDALARAKDEKLSPEKRAAAQAEAKDMAVRFMDNMNLVREGKISEYSARKAQENLDVTMRARTNKPSGEQVERESAKRDAIGWQREEVSGQPHNEYVGGVRHVADDFRVGMIKRSLAAIERDHGRQATMEEILHLGEQLGHDVRRSTFGELMAPHRPDNPIMAAVFDAVHDRVKDIPAHVVSADMLQAIVPNARGAYNPKYGVGLYRHDTLVERTVFHEALHAATARALYGSKRLEHLVSRLQAIIKYDPKLEPWRQTEAYKKALGQNTHEFISELFTRPEVARMVAAVQLRPQDIAALRREGYQVDKGKSLLGTLWSNFLQAIGFKADTPNAMKVAVDMLQDVFDREQQLRARDTALGITDIGRIYSDAEIRMLAREDPIHGTAAHRAMLRGDHAAAASALMDMADKMSPATADASIRYLHEVNRGYWDGQALPEKITMRDSQEIRSDFARFLDDRMGGRTKDAIWQIKNRFGTPLRHLSQGIRYTNDLGNNLEEGFRKILQPLKDALSRREHFAVKYMDDSGANKLIDDIATLKHAIGDSQLWADWQKLLVRESYSRAFADEALGSGRNKHIDATSLRDRQSVADHAANKALYDSIAARSPDLVRMRNEIHAFMDKEMTARHQYLARDMVLKWNVAKHGDDDAIEALVKNIRREDKLMTPKEKAAFDRVVGEHDSRSYKDWEEKRSEIRKVIDDSVKAGPHVPFMRHGKHVVYAEYEVTPEKGTRYVEVAQADLTDVHKAYDFRELSGAEKFVDETLSHPDVQVTVRNAHEIVYDKTTGERAKIYTDEEMQAFAEKGEKHTNRYLTEEDVEQMRENDLPTDQYETWHRVEFNPTEYVRFASEREAHEYRDQLNRDEIHPNVTTKVTHVETPKDPVGRANVAYTQAELKQWINRMEASAAYQQMTKEQQADWKREMRIEAARVTATAGRRTMMMPREYAKGASEDILKNTIDFAGNNARANAELRYRDDIDKSRQAAHDYTHQFRYTAGTTEGSRLEGKDHRARQDVLREFDRRMFAPPRVHDGWAQGIKRALQVSMISHLADTAYLAVQAIEPWVLGAAITASRHGIRAYSEMASATALIHPGRMAKMAGLEFWGAGKEVLGGKPQRQTNYETYLVDQVTGAGNTRGDGALLGRMIKHMAGRGLIARDVGLEAERIHDPSSNWAFRKLDAVDGMFRSGATGVETGNRAISAISNFRLEYERAIKDGAKPDVAYEQALRYAEDNVFKSAGDYGAWNNPRYLNNPFIKLAGQFKKYPLRIASVWVDAMIGAAKGDREKQKQIAYMFIAQSLAGGVFSTPVSTIPGGLVNAAYILGITDDNWGDFLFSQRKVLTDMMGVDGADIAMHGIFDLTGANVSSKMDQSSPLFFGDPEKRDSGEMFGALGKLAFGAPGDSADKLRKGIGKTFEAMGHFEAGADEKGWSVGAEAAEDLLQVKAIHDIIRAITLANSGPAGMPTGNEASTMQAAVQAIGFTPTEISRKQEEKRTIKREIKKESTARNVWVNRWVEATSSSEKSAIWRNIQRDYNAGLPDRRLHVSMGDLMKAEQRKKREAKRDDTKLGIKMSGRQKAFADIHGYFNAED